MCFSPRSRPPRPSSFFGLDNTYTRGDRPAAHREQLRLPRRRFRRVNCAPLREESQDHYSNMGTADVHDAAKVESVPSNSPFDRLPDHRHPAQRAAPRWAPRAARPSLLDRYGELFATLAKKAKGEWAASRPATLLLCADARRRQSPALDSAAERDAEGVLLRTSRRGPPLGRRMACASSSCASPTASTAPSARRSRRWRRARRGPTRAGVVSCGGSTSPSRASVPIDLAGVPACGC